MRRTCLIYIFLISAIGAGCGDEPIDLTPIAPAAPDADPPPTPRVDGGVAPDPDMGLAPVLYPDEDVFTQEVLPILVAQCGAGCHLAAINLTNNDNPGGNDYEVSPDDIAGSIAEILHPNYTTPENAAESEILLHHGGTYFRTLEEKRVVRDWIADTVNPKGIGTMNAGPSGLSCDHLPSGDGIGPDGWFTAFETVINPMFVGTAEEPEGYCSGSGCHTDVRPGDNLNLLPITDPCSARWNFLVSQAFITLDNLTASPLLRQPLGEPTLDPNVSTHGGQEVFKGQDENYTRLRQWLVLIQL